MFIVKMENEIVAAFDAIFNGEKLYVYQGAKPTGDAYVDPATNSADELGVVDPVSLSVFETRMFFADAGQSFVGSQTGTAAWWALYNSTTGEVMVGDCSLLAGAGELQLSTLDVVNTVSVDIDDFEVEVQAGGY